MRFLSLTFIVIQCSFFLSATEDQSVRNSLDLTLKIEQEVCQLYTRIDKEIKEQLEFFKDRSNERKSFLKRKNKEIKSLKAKQKKILKSITNCQSAIYSFNKPRSFLSGSKESNQNKLKRLQIDSADLYREFSPCTQDINSSQSEIYDLERKSIRLTSIQESVLKFNDSHKYILYFLSKNLAIDLTQSEDLYELIPFVLKIKEHEIAKKFLLSFSHLFVSKQDLFFLESMNEYNWKAAKYFYQSSIEFSLEDVLEFQNENQIFLLKKLLIKKISPAQKKHLLALAKSEKFNRLIDFVIEKGQEIPSEFFTNIKGLQYQDSKKINYVYDAAVQLRDFVFTDKTWVFLSKISSESPYEALLFFIELNKRREDLVFVDENSKITKEEFLEYFYESINRVDSDCKLSFLKYFCDKVFFDPQASLYKTFFDFAQINIKDLLPLISSELEVESIKIFIDNRFDFFKKSFIEDNSLDYLLEKKILFKKKYIQNINKYQLDSIKFTLDKGNLFVDFKEFSNINTLLDYELFLFLYENNIDYDRSIFKLISSNLHTFIVRKCASQFDQIFLEEILKLYKKTPYYLEGPILEYLEEIEQDNPSILFSLIKSLFSVSNNYQLNLIKKLVKHDSFSKFSHFVERIKNENELRFIEKIIGTASEKFLRDVFENTNLISKPFADWVVLYCLRYNLLFSETMLAIENSNTLFEVSESLSAESFLREWIINHLLAKEYDCSIERNSYDKEEKNLDVFDKIEDEKIIELILKHPLKKEIISKLSSLEYLVCPTVGCPNLLTKIKGALQTCDVCSKSFCLNCQQRAHIGTCTDYARMRFCSEPQSYVKMANFTGGLSNVCFFNSIMKFLMAISSQSEEFRISLNPMIKPIREKEGESGESYHLRVRLHEALFELIETGISGYDPLGDSLVTQSKIVLNLLADNLTAQGIVTPGTLSIDQFDAQEVLNHIFDILDLPKTANIRIDSSHLIEVPETSYTSSTMSKDNFLSLSILGKSSIKSSLEDFFKTIELTGEEKYHHEESDAYVDASKTVRMVNKPNVLFLHLKDRHLLHFDKDLMRVVSKDNSEAIQLDETLKIPIYDKDDMKTPPQEAVYRRVAVVLRHSFGMESGHYTCGIWTNRKNDEQISLPRMGTFFMRGGDKTKKEADCSESLVIHDDQRINFEEKSMFAKLGSEKSSYLVAYILE